MKITSRGLYPPPIFCRKAEAARPESQDVGVQGREAFFASSEGAKRSEILAARAGQRFSLILEAGVLLPANSEIKAPVPTGAFLLFYDEYFIVKCRTATSFPLFS